jgi:hypothetical protein
MSDHPVYVVPNKGVDADGHGDGDGRTVRTHRRLIPASLTGALIFGCGTGSSPSASGAAATPHASVSQSCHQIYENWRLHSGQLPIVRKLSSDVTKLQSAASADDFPRTWADMVKVGADARQLPAYQMPACADPAGYYPKWIAALEAVGHNAKSANPAR